MPHTSLIRRDEDREHRSVTFALGTAPITQAATVFFHDALRYPEAEPRSQVFLRRKERLEKSASRSQRDSRPRVPNRQPYSLALPILPLYSALHREDDAIVRN